MKKCYMYADCKQSVQEYDGNITASIKNKGSEVKK